MPTIYHDLVITAPILKVFEGITNPALIDEWWTEKCQGTPELNKEYTLGFTPECIWKASVTVFEKNKSFELTLTDAQEDWLGTKVGFVVEENGKDTKLKFQHCGWKEINEHFRISSYCWAVYLRILKRYLEAGIRIPYKERDSV